MTDQMTTTTTTTALVWINFFGNIFLVGQKSAHGSEPRVGRGAERFLQPKKKGFSIFSFILRIGVKLCFSCRILVSGFVAS